MDDCYFPTVACLCPTAYRPWLLENAVACYQAQDYPAGRRRLVILDDSGIYEPQEGDGWELHATAARYPSLPEKYHRLLDLAGDCDVIAVWEDDDVYLPWHLSAIVRSMGWDEETRQPSSPWAKPRTVWTMCPDLKMESGLGRFHASLAAGRVFLQGVQGWPLTHRGDFDLQFIARLAEAGRQADPSAIATPSYIFRWASTSSPHGQGFMRGPGDQTWYDRANYGARKAFDDWQRRTGWQRGTPLRPALDEETRRLFETIEKRG